MKVISKQRSKPIHIIIQTQEIYTNLARAAMYNLGSLRLTYQKGHI